MAKLPNDFRPDENYWDAIVLQYEQGSMAYFEELGLAIEAGFDIPGRVLVPIAQSLKILSDDKVKPAIRLNEFGKSIGLVKRGRPEDFESKFAIALNYWALRKGDESNPAMSRAKAIEHIIECGIVGRNGEQIPAPDERTIARAIKVAGETAVAWLDFIRAEGDNKHA